MINNNSHPTAFQNYMAEQKRLKEQKRLAELQQRYPTAPDYTNMSLRNELQTRYDLDEMQRLQQKYAPQQTPLQPSPISTSTPVPQSAYRAPSQQVNPQPSAWKNILRKGEQLASGALDGLSLGWADELEGAASAVGYGLASLNPSWNKSGESAWDAMKRGYAQGRDKRRQVLAQGLQENPVATTVAQMTGAFASPVKFFGYTKAAPLTIKNVKNFRNAMANGLTYGIGAGQDNWQSYLGHTVAGLGGNLGGHYWSKQIAGRAAVPVLRNTLNTSVGTALESGIDATKNWYDNYNK